MILNQKEQDLRLGQRNMYQAPKDCYPHHVHLPQLWRPDRHRRDNSGFFLLLLSQSHCPGGKAAGEFKPDYVVPFQIDKKKAQEIFTQWVGRKNLYLIISFCQSDREHDRCVFSLLVI